MSNDLKAFIIWIVPKLVAGLTFMWTAFLLVSLIPRHLGFLTLTVLLTTILFCFLIAFASAVYAHVLLERHLP